MLLILNLFVYVDFGAPLVQKIMGKVEAYYLAEDIGLIPEIVLLDLNQCEVVPVTLLSNVFMPVHHLHLSYTMGGVMLTGLVLCAMGHLTEMPSAQVP